MIPDLFLKKQKRWGPLGSHLNFLKGEFVNKKKVLSELLRIINEIAPIIIENEDFIDAPDGAVNKFRLIKKSFDLDRRKEISGGNLSKTVRLIGHLSAALDEKDLNKFSNNINYVIALSILWKISKEE